METKEASKRRKAKEKKEHKEMLKRIEELTGYTVTFV